MALRCEDSNPEHRLAVNNHAASSVTRITEAVYLRELHSCRDVESLCQQLSGEEFQHEMGHEDASAATWRKYARGTALASAALFIGHLQRRGNPHASSSASGRARGLQARKLEWEAEFGSDMQYLPLVLVPNGREFRGWSGKPQPWQKKNNTEKTAKLAKKPTMPRVCLD